MKFGGGSGVSASYSVCVFFVDVVFEGFGFWFEQLRWVDLDQVRDCGL